MHGPGHLFCCGVNTNAQGQSLAYAAWAGYYAAKGDHANAGACARLAEQAAGHALVGQSGGPGFLYVASETREPDLEMVDYLIECLGLIRNQCKRRAEKNKLTGAAAPSPTPEAISSAVDEGARVVAPGDTPGDSISGPTAPVRTDGAVTETPEAS